MTFKDRGLVITVDGPAASGKSSASRIVAERLGMEHVDVGIVFRLITLHLMDRGFKFDKSPETLLKNEIEVEFKDSKFFLNGKNVSTRIRDKDVSLNAAKMGANNFMKEKVYEIERNIAKKGESVIFSGRDTGAIVFPDADLKFYINASIEKRARRRHSDYRKLMNNVTLDEVYTIILKRDEYDIKRGSLIKPENAITIDNSGDTLEKAVLGMEEEIKRYISKMDEK